METDSPSTTTCMGHQLKSNPDFEFGPLVFRVKSRMSLSSLCSPHLSDNEGYLTWG